MTRVGSNGPWVDYKGDGYWKNQGWKWANLIKNKDYDKIKELCFSNNSSGLEFINVTKQDNNNDGDYNDSGESQLDYNTGIAFCEEFVKGFDENGDGITTNQELKNNLSQQDSNGKFNPFSDTMFYSIGLGAADIGNGEGESNGTGDGKVSADELLAAFLSKVGNNVSVFKNMWSTDYVIKNSCINIAKMNDSNPNTNLNSFKLTGLQTLDQQYQARRSRIKRVLKASKKWRASRSFTSL